MYFLNIPTNTKQLTITKDASGVVLTKGIGMLVEENIEVTSIEVNKNTKFKVDYFNFYTNKVILICKKLNEEYKVSVSYDFLLENCMFENNQTNKPIYAVHTYSKIHNVIDSKTFLYTVICLLIFICGVLIGRVC